MKSTNHRLQTWPFEPVEVNVCFLRGTLRWLTSTINVTAALSRVKGTVIATTTIQWHVTISWGEGGEGVYTGRTYSVAYTRTSVFAYIYLYYLRKDQVSCINMLPSCYFVEPCLVRHWCSDGKSFLGRTSVSTPWVYCGLFPPQGLVDRFHIWTISCQCYRPTFSLRRRSSSRVLQLLHQSSTCGQNISNSSPSKVLMTYIVVSIKP